MSTGDSGTAFVLGIVSEKGGVGKTFNTFNLSTFLAAYHGKKVLAIDFDSSGSLTMTMQRLAESNGYRYDEAGTTENLFSSSESLPLPNQALENLWYYSVNVGNNLINFSEQDVINLYEAIDLLKENFDFILCDSAPTFGRILQVVLNCSDGILSPSIPDITTMQTTLSLVDYVQRSGKDDTAKMLGVVFTTPQGLRSSLAKEFLDLYKQRFGDLLMDSVIGYYATYSYFYNSGQVMTSDSKNRKEFDAYSKFVDEVLYRANPDVLESLNPRPTQRRKFTLGGE